MNCSSAGRLCYILVSTSGRAKDQTYELKGRIHSECQQPPTNPLHCLLESFHSSGSAFLTPCASVFQGVSHCLRETAKLGPLAFYKVKKNVLPHHCGYLVPLLIRCSTDLTHCYDHPWMLRFTGQLV